MEQKRAKKKKIWRIVKWSLLGLGIFIVSAVVAIALYVQSKFEKLGQDINIGESEQFEDFEEEEIIINDFKEEEVGVGYTNFVLFGADSRDNDVNSDLNTDSIIIVSLNNATKELKLLSVYRDTLLDLSNGSIQKCNSAYRKGGAKQAINMLNMNLDLNIQKYVTVNFTVVSDVIDMIGGVEVDVSEAEMKAVNTYLAETAKVAGKDAVFLTQAGVQTLDGVQATTYARIRKGVGNDYARTERQRELITLTLQKVMTADLATINKIIDVVFPKIATNFTLTDVLKYAKDLTKYQIGESSGFPFDKGDGKVSGKGSCVYPITLESNVQKLHEFLYDKVEYQPSDKVCSISQEIEAIVTGDTSTDDGNTSIDDGNISTDDDNTSTDDGNTSTDDDNTSTDDDNTSTDDGNTSTDDDDNTSTDDGNTSTDDGNTSTDDGNTSTDDGNTSTDDGNTSTDDDNTSTDDGNTSTDDDNTSTDDGNTSTDDGNTSTDDGNTSAGDDDTSTDDGNTSTDDGNTSTDDGNTSTDDGNTSTDNGNTSTDNGNTSTDDGNTSTDDSNTSTDDGNTSTDDGNTSAEDNTDPGDLNIFFDDFIKSVETNKATE